MNPNTFKLLKNNNPGLCNKKAQIWISAILYILIITVVLTIVVKAGTPILEKLQDKTSFTKTKNLFLALNEHVKDVGDEGAGSQRVIPLEIEKGYLRVQNGGLQWDLRTSARILETGSEIDLGNMVVTSNSDVEASKQTNTYLLQNTRLKIYFTRCEDKNTCNFSSSNIIKNMTFINPDTGVEYTTSGNFSVEFGTGAGTFSGYSKLEQEGVNMGSSTILYFLNTTNTSVYTIVEFSLASNQDFMQTQIR